MERGQIVSKGQMSAGYHVRVAAHAGHANGAIRVGHSSVVNAVLLDRCSHTVEYNQYTKIISVATRCIAKQNQAKQNHGASAGAILQGAAVL